MKFIHAADLHIDSPLTGLDRYEGAPVDSIRGATRRATENLITLCLHEQVDLLVLAGDLFDGDWKDYSTGLFFVAQMSRLKQAGIPVVVVAGNHDAASQISRHLTLPGNVHVLPASEPDTLKLNDLGVAIHGQSYQNRIQMADLASRYPDADPEYFNIGLLHTSLTGRAGHEPYAPCSVQTLQSKGYQYWALGHVHQREVISTDPWIVFSGNLQARHIREIGPKGASLVRVEGKQVVEVEHRVLDVVRFDSVEVTAATEVDAHGVLEAVMARLDEALESAGGRTLVARVQVVGATRAHAELHRDIQRWTHQAASFAAERSHLWLQRIAFNTRALVNTRELLARGDAVGQVARALDALRRDEDQASALRHLFEDFLGRLPAEVREGEDALRLDDTEAMQELLADVERSILVQLVHEETQGDA